MAKIVVVDDSKLMRNLLQHLLEQAGHEVEAWEEVTAAEVPAMVIAAHPDLIISDYQMPGCNGATLLRLARKADAHLPIVILTASRDPAMIDGLVRQNVTRVIHKPISEETLLEAVRQVL